MRAVPQPSRWDDLLGPFYTTNQVAKLRGRASRQAIADSRKRRTLLGLKTADGVLVYPAFQFDEHNDVIAGLPEILQCFRGSSIDGWSLAAWLISPMRSLDGLSALDWLRQGNNPAPVLRLARSKARRLSR